MRRISFPEEDERSGSTSIGRRAYRPTDLPHIPEREIDLDAGIDDLLREAEPDDDIFLVDHEEEENKKGRVGNEDSAGTHRLNRILRSGDGSAQPKPDVRLLAEKATLEQAGDFFGLEAVGKFVGAAVIPPLRVDNNSIGGQMLDGYPESLVQECLFVSACQAFESTGTESTSALQYPKDYAKHKRSLSMLIESGQSSSKVRFVIIARSTNRPLLEATLQRQQRQVNRKQRKDNDKERDDVHDQSERTGYDEMFAADNEDDLSSTLEDSVLSNPHKEEQDKDTSFKTDEQEIKKLVILPEEEISSFPVLVCVTMQQDGAGPEIRKLISLDQLTTVQDLHSTVVQLAFSNGDTVRLDFGEDGDRNDVVESSLNKERFIWSLLQIHSMLCMAVVERNLRGTSFLPPLNLRNLDRAELQYIATVNDFLKNDESLNSLLSRQSVLMEADSADGGGEAKTRDMDTIAYDLMMGNFTTRITLFHSDEERKDAEEIFNSPEWTSLLDREDNAAANAAEHLEYRLQSRMRDLEAETCRRLIAWEDEKNLSHSGNSKLHTDTDSRDTVDALALASLFKTLESLDSELGGMESWLQERAAAIKPLTDDCSEIEKENRDLEQQWKSYEVLGKEMERLLHGHEISDTTDSILKNPAAALVYNEEGLVDIDNSEEGIEKIYDAGKALLDAIEFPRKSGAMHLRAVSDRATGHSSVKSVYCTALAQIIGTLMEQFKTEVVAKSDYGKVSKSDTHTMIAKKVKETQRSFQSSLLTYIKLIEILAALSADMLPALRESYAGMVSEGIMMKKRMKGYFQALPGKNVAYMHRSGKDLKDYVPFDETLTEETVNAPDIRAALGEILPVIAREAHFTSALFGATNKDQDGREKKRNFENAKKAVDKASQHYRYYVNRTCGIIDVPEKKPPAGEANQEETRGDPLLCLVASVYLVEAMDNYIDREKKGGDHSLSLAYVRATILDMRKKADKQWVSWVDKQIKWIKSHDGVPVTGKRAGIFPSYARFPIFLDHVLLCCKEGRDKSYEPDLASIKVVNFYLQKMVVTMLESLKDCSNRETTDQAYAASVMRMENTYFLTESIKQRGEVMSKVFKKQVTKANAICKESTDAYLGWMIKREFAALHDLFSRISKIRKELGDLEVTAHVPKTQFVKILQKEANREILKEKIGTMYSRMEKHLCEEGSLLPVAWKTLVKVLYEWFGRWDKLCGSIYRHKLDPGPVDIVRIARSQA